MSTSTARRALASLRRVPILLLGVVPGVPGVTVGALGALTGAPLMPAAAVADVERPRVVRCELTRERLVLVPVTVNGSGPHLFLLDTGGSSTIVSTTLARQLALMPAGRERIEFSAGSRTVDRGLLADLRVGTERFTNVDILWMSLDSLRTIDPRIQGVIGQDLLLTRNFLLDYEASRLMFDDDLGEARRGERVPIDRADGRPLVRGVAHHAGARSGHWRFLIDSAATHVILFDRGQDTFLATLRASAHTTMTMRNHGGTRPVLTTTIEGITLAGTTETTLRGLTAAVVPEDAERGRVEEGLLPASVFRAIYFDNRGGAVVLNPSPPCRRRGTTCSS